MDMIRLVSGSVKVAEMPALSPSEIEKARQKRVREVWGQEERNGGGLRCRQ